jgi:hypothetical protein
LQKNEERIQWPHLCLLLPCTDKSWEKIETITTRAFGTRDRIWARLTRHRVF